MQYAPTASEQLFIELINQARANPSAEAARQGTSLGNGVSATPSQPLAFNDDLSQAAEGHSKAMLSGNFFNHVDQISGATLTDRVSAAGYQGNFFGENIAVQGAFTQADDAAIVSGQHNGLWNSLGHRQNFMSGDYSEIGVGVETGAFTIDGVTYPVSTMTTHNFGEAGKTYLTGVVIDDADGDAFYDIGEGQGAVTITATSVAGSFTTQTWDSGGYSLELEPGDYEVTFSGGDLEGSITKDVTIADRNIKLDALEQDADQTAPAEPVADTSDPDAPIETAETEPEADEEPNVPAEPETEDTEEPDPVEMSDDTPEELPEETPTVTEDPQETPPQQPTLASTCPFMDDEIEFAFTTNWTRASDFFDTAFDTGRFANALFQPDRWFNPLSDRGDGCLNPDLAEDSQPWWQDIEHCWA